VGENGDHRSGRPDELPRFRAAGEEVVHEGWAITLVQARFVDPEGVAFERDIVRHPGAVAVVAVTDDDSVVLVHQYRPALDQWILEVPAGTRDVDGEAEVRTAQRELAEEVGYAAAEMVLLTRCAVTPGFCDELSSVFLATGLDRVALDRQGIEERYMRIEHIPLSRFDAMVDDGTIVDATTILGVGLARRRLAARSATGAPGA
jgi:8-oxo-dGTP pyrophosphatase MutT (NUDIX family)